MIPEKESQPDFVPGGRTKEAKVLADMSRIEEWLFYEKSSRPELADVHTYIKVALEEFARATGEKLDGREEPEEPESSMTLRFSVKRNSISATQQFAEVYCNGEFVVSFGDDKSIIKPGEKYFGNLSGECWGSTKPDASFIRGALFHRYDNIYHVSKPIRSIIEREIARETECAKRRKQA